MTDLWSLRPEVGCVETLEWFTNGLGGRTGEQRLALRPAPRQSFDYSSRLLRDQQFSRVKTFARRNGALPVYVPVWGEQVQLSGSISSGASTLTFDTTYGDWREGSFLVVWQDDETYVVAEIDAITDTAITLTGALGTSFTSPVVCPVRTAWMTDGMSIDRQAVFSNVGAQFLVRDNIDLGGDYVSTYPQYQSLDVLTEAPRLVQDVSESIIRVTQFVDSGLGPVEVETVKNYADFGQMLSFHDERGPALWNRRLWLHSLYGKQGTFWLPTFNMDLQLQASFLAAATNVVVKSIGPTGGYLNKHVMIELANGNRYFREITNASGPSGGNDTIVISSALGEGVAPADVVKFCFISLARLNADRVEINHSYELCSVVSIPVVEVPA